MRKELDIIIPVAIDLDWVTYDEIIRDILELYNDYGFKRFALAAPSGGWRAVGFPPKEFYEDRAGLFLKAKNELSQYGIELGWWITATLKSGRSEKYTGVIREDGTESPFQNCPFDNVFIKDFAEKNLLFSSFLRFLVRFWV